ncbi:hypothetical protein AB0L59_09110 [Streptomyces sp. NPDC052109]|uniref:hypothetical protein n=1 Tax=Streptomyces sp. NPDC052109 TaxID=3155527 RepID=UPI00343C5C3B
MRRGLVAVAVLTAMTVAGCDDGPRPDLVVKGTPPASAYAGPLYVPTRQLDASGPRALRLASGAAGRALECDGEIFDGAGPDGWAPSDGGGTPEEGLTLFFDMDEAALPDHGFRVERREADRVLYSYDIGGRTKAAVVVAKDQQDRPGWGPETHASCDPAEFPAAFAAAQGWEVWTDRDGGRVPVSRLSSSTGPEHCGWQSVHFLRLDDATYARDPEDALGGDLLTAPYRARVPLPAGAHDTGYRYRHWRLWLTDDKATAYVRTPGAVEAWPRLRRRVACD